MTKALGGYQAMLQAKQRERTDVLAKIDEGRTPRRETTPPRLDVNVNVNEAELKRLDDRGNTRIPGEGEGDEAARMTDDQSEETKSSGSDSATGKAVLLREQGEAMVKSLEISGPDSLQEYQNNRPLVPVQTGPAKLGRVGPSQGRSMNFNSEGEIEECREEGEGLTLEDRPNDSASPGQAPEGQLTLRPVLMLQDFKDVKVSPDVHNILFVRAPTVKDKNGINELISEYQKAVIQVVTSSSGPLDKEVMSAHFWGMVDLLRRYSLHASKLLSSALIDPTKASKEPSVKRELALYARDLVQIRQSMIAQDPKYMSNTVSAALYSSVLASDLKPKFLQYGMGVYEVSLASKKFDFSGHQEKMKALREELETAKKLGKKEESIKLEERLKRYEGGDYAESKRELEVVQNYVASGGMSLDDLFRAYYPLFEEDAFARLKELYKKDFKKSRFNIIGHMTQKLRSAEDIARKAEVEIKSLAMEFAQKSLKNLDISFEEEEGADHLGQYVEMWVRIISKELRFVIYEIQLSEFGPEAFSELNEVKTLTARSSNETNELLEYLLLNHRMNIPRDHKKTILAKARDAGLIGLSSYDPESRIKAFRFVHDPQSVMLEERPDLFTELVVRTDMVHLHGDELAQQYEIYRKFFKRVSTSPEGTQLPEDCLIDIPIEAFVLYAQDIRSSISESLKGDGTQSAGAPVILQSDSWLENPHIQKLVMLNQIYYIMSGVKNGIARVSMERHLHLDQAGKRKEADEAMVSVETNPLMTSLSEVMVVVSKHGTKFLGDLDKSFEDPETYQFTHYRAADGTLIVSSDMFQAR